MFVTDQSLVVLAIMLDPVLSIVLLLQVPVIEDTSQDKAQGDKDQEADGHGYYHHLVNEGHAVVQVTVHSRVQVWIVTAGLLKNVIGNI